MHLIHCLFFILTMWDISLYVCHIPGMLITVADAIPHDNIPLSFSKLPDTDRNAVPADLVQLLLLLLEMLVQQLFTAGLATSTQCSYWSGEKC